MNAALFLGEMMAGLFAGSASLQTDALDCLGDSANDAISLGVAGLGLIVHARAAMAKGLTLIVVAFWVLGRAAWHLLLAAAGVFGTGHGWPDVSTATVMAGLRLRGGWQIVQRAIAERRTQRPTLASDMARPVTRRA